MSVENLKKRIKRLEKPRNTADLRARLLAELDFGIAYVKSEPELHSILPKLEEARAQAAYFGSFKYEIDCMCKEIGRVMNDVDTRNTHNDNMGGGE